MIRASADSVKSSNLGVRLELREANAKREENALFSFASDEASSLDVSEHGHNKTRYLVGRESVGFNAGAKPQRNERLPRPCHPSAERF